MKTFSLWIFGAALILLQSCSMTSQTTYYKDSATSMESDILVDPSVLGLMNNFSAASDSTKNSSDIDLNSISTDWKSLYDLQKNGKVVANKKESEVLKKLFLKANKNSGNITGISLKYDRLLPKEVASLFSDSKELEKLPLQDFAKWDGKKLIIDTGKFNVAEMFDELSKAENDSVASTPKTKSDSITAYGKQMASGMLGMLKVMNLNFSNTLKFQKPIKSIEGKHDFVQQIDSKTVKININTKDLWDETQLKNKDPQIIITTE